VGGEVEGEGKGGRVGGGEGKGGREGKGEGGRGRERREGIWPPMKIP